MLNANPKGGRPMTRIGAVEVEDGLIKYKIGYCACGGKILITRDDAERLLFELDHLKKETAFVPVKVRILKWVAEKASNKIRSNLGS